QQHRIRDRRPADQREAFTSAILPPYLRKTKSLEGLLPWLYLKGVSTGDFSEALQAILGPDAPGLSATTITRLKASWEEEFAAWNKRSLAGKRYVYVWADGVHFNIRLEGERAFDLFVKTYEAKYPKAAECLSKDRDVLLASYDFPAEHWVHIRTTNPIESVFSTVRLRHDKTKGSGSRVACLTMVYKLMESASKGWRSLNGSPLLAEVVRGTKFIDGIREKPAA